MANFKKESNEPDHNYVVEDFDDYAIVKRKKEGVQSILKVHQFDESILLRLEELDDTDAFRFEKLKGVLARLRETF